MANGVQAVAFSLRFLIDELRQMEASSLFEKQRNDYEKTDPGVSDGQKRMFGGFCFMCEWRNGGIGRLPFTRSTTVAGLLCEASGQDTLWEIK